MATTHSCSPFINQIELFIWQYLWLEVMSTGTAEPILVPINLAIDRCPNYVICPLATLEDGYSELEIANWCGG
jgi:hypothetical protein